MMRTRWEYFTDISVFGGVESTWLVFAEALQGGKFFASLWFARTAEAKNSRTTAYSPKPNY